MRHIFGIALAFVASPAVAEVVTATDAGFVISSTETVAATPIETWTMLRAPAKYWSKDHSWTGDAANLWMDAQAGGCFCEKIPGATPLERGSVEHARIIYAAPGKMLRMRGALGPMQSDAITGTLTWTLEPVLGGTRVTVRYAVGGFRDGGLAILAPAVDAVLQEQLTRLKSATEQAGGNDSSVKSSE